MCIGCLLKRVKFGLEIRDVMILQPTQYFFSFSHTSPSTSNFLSLRSRHLQLLLIFHGRNTHLHDTCIHQVSYHVVWSCCSQDTLNQVCGHNILPTSIPAGRNETQQRASAWQECPELFYGDTRLVHQTEKIVGKGEGMVGGLFVLSSGFQECRIIVCSQVSFIRFHKWIFGVTYYNYKSQH